MVRKTRMRSKRRVSRKTGGKRRSRKSRSKRLSRKSRSKRRSRKTGGKRRSRKINRKKHTGGDGAGYQSSNNPIDWFAGANKRYDTLREEMEGMNKKTKENSKALKRVIYLYDQNYRYTGDDAEEKNINLKRYVNKVKTGDFSSWALTPAEKEEQRQRFEKEAKKIGRAVGNTTPTEGRPYLLYKAEAKAKAKAEAEQAKAKAEQAEAEQAKAEAEQAEA
jgi:hypothetical protein